MNIEDLEKFRKLSKVANGSFGTTGPNPARISTQSVKFKVIDEHTLHATYTSIVTVQSKSMLRELRTKHQGEGMAMIKAGVENFMKEFELQNEDEKLKLEIDGNTVDHGVEHVSYSMYSPSQTVFFRVFCLVRVK